MIIQPQVTIGNFALSERAGMVLTETYHAWYDKKDYYDGYIKLLEQYEDDDILYFAIDLNGEGYLYHVPPITTAYSWFTNKPGNYYTFLHIDAVKAKEDYGKDYWRDTLTVFQAYELKELFRTQYAGELNAE